MKYTILKTEDLRTKSKKYGIILKVIIERKDDSMKKLTSIILMVAFVMMMFIANVPAAGATIVVKVNNKALTFTRAPYLKGKVVMVQGDKITAAISAKYSYAGKQITISKGSTTLIMKIGNNKGQLNKKVVTLETAPDIRQGVVYIPVISFSKLIGVKSASYDAKIKVVAITTFVTPTPKPTEKPSAPTPTPLVGSSLSDETFKRLYYDTVPFESSFKTMKQANEDYAKDTNHNETNKLLNLAKDFIETEGNIDYRSIGDAWIKKMLTFYSPTYEKTVNGKKVAISEYLKNEANEKKINKEVQECKFVTDSNLVYIRDGFWCVRGTAYFNYKNPTNKAVFKGSLKDCELNNWYRLDIDIEFYQLYLNKKYLNTVWIYKIINKPVLVDGPGN